MSAVEKAKNELVKRFTSKEFLQSIDLAFGTDYYAVKSGIILKAIDEVLGEVFSLKEFSEDERRISKLYCNAVSFIYFGE